MIYFVAIEGTNYVKVGRATDLKKRLAGLTTAQPFDLLVLNTIETAGYTEDLILEKQIHAYLKPFRIRREWFEIDRDKVLETVNYFENSEAYRLNPIFEDRYLCLRVRVDYVDGGEVLHAITEPCFFCRVSHIHGAPNSTEVINGIHTFGHRVAHCRSQHIDRRHPNGRVLNSSYGYYLWVENSKTALPLIARW